jgi:hypothetical protein
VKSRPSWVYKDKWIKHTVELTADVQIITRQCDFCEAWTPSPTKEQLDNWVKAMATKASTFVLAPCIAREGFEEYADKQAQGKCQFRPEGWQLLGDRSWACPDCSKRAEAALEGK